MIKKIGLIMMSMTLIILVSGCLKKDSMQDISIYTTVYPIEYVTEYLYGNNATVFSVYPDGEVPSKYKFTDKQLKDYSKGTLFIFNGANEEKELVTKFFNYNRSIKIIDATSSIDAEYAVEEMWLNPSNLLMLAQNVKNGLSEYINNGYLKTEINDNYDKLKIEISNLDAKMKLMAENANDSTIVVSNNMFKFLGDKYNFNVISLDGESNAKAVEQMKEYAMAEKINYVFVPKGKPLKEDLQKIVDELGLEVVELHTLANIDSNERKEKEDYLSIMNENMELIRNEIYE